MTIHFRMPQKASFVLLAMVLAALASCIRTPLGYDVAVVSARWDPTPTSLVVEDQLQVLTEEELTALQTAGGLHGTIQVLAYRSAGAPNRSRIVLILQKPVDQPVRLPVPDDVSVIYIQESNGWRAIPNQVPTLIEYFLRVENVVVNGVNGTDAILEIPVGGEELLGGVDWPTGE